MPLSQSGRECPTFLIWDSNLPPPSDDRIVILWRQYSARRDTTTLSIPKLVEENADALRGRLLGWLHDLCETQINGRRLVDHLLLRPGFSYWWMTLLAEKSYGKSGQYYDAIRLMALEEFAQKNSPSKLILVSNNDLLHHILKNWCNRSQFDYERQHFPVEKGRSIRKVRDRSTLLLPARALASLIRYAIRRWPFRQFRSEQYSGRLGNVTIADYLFHLTKESMDNGVFTSNYWGLLVDKLEESKVRVNWLHHYVGNDSSLHVQTTANLITQFNSNYAGVHYHSVFDSALSLQVLWRTLLDYGFLLIRGILLSRIRHKFKPHESHLDLWPLLKTDWQNSIFGSNAIANCLSLNLFEKILGDLPKQRLGIYLQEHQGWESAFLFAWKQAGHGCLIGVPHATVRFWDLRYFVDPRSTNTDDFPVRPTPDLVALNGPVAIDTALEGGLEAENILEVEALRYLYLSKLRNTATDNGGETESALRVLVLGDYFSEITNRQMQWLVSAASKLSSDIRYIIRPHPMYPIDLAKYPSLTCTLSNSPLGELLPNCDLAFTGNITSAAVDAYVAGVNVVSMLDGETLNLSPLRGLKGVFYVTNPDELAEVLLQDQSPVKERTEYFYLDQKLTRWNKLLNASLSPDS